jgi:hypothetical protein
MEGEVSMIDRQFAQLRVASPRFGGLRYHTVFTYAFRFWSFRRRRGELRQWDFFLP